MQDIYVLAIEDGWARYSPILSRKEAERTAHALWNTGKYEQVRIVQGPLPFGFYCKKAVTRKQLLNKY